MIFVVWLLCASFLQVEGRSFSSCAIFNKWITEAVVVEGTNEKEDELSFLYFYELHEYPKLFCNPYCYLKTYIFEINDVKAWTSMSVMFTDLDDEPDGENPCGVKKDLEAMVNHHSILREVDLSSSEKWIHKKKRGRSNVGYGDCYYYTIFGVVAPDLFAHHDASDRFVAVVIEI
ncbi:hypothetical protein ACJX0J_037916 [Zea mays]